MKYVRHFSDLQNLDLFDYLKTAWPKLTAKVEDVKKLDDEPTEGASVESRQKTRWTAQEICWPFRRKHINSFAVRDQRTFFSELQRIEVAYEILELAGNDPDECARRHVRLPDGEVFQTQAARRRGAAGERRVRDGLPRARRRRQAARRARRRRPAPQAARQLGQLELLLPRAAAARRTRSSLAQQCALGSFRCETTLARRSASTTSSWTATPACSSTRRLSAYSACWLVSARVVVAGAFGAT